MPDIINEGFTEKTLAELKKLCLDNFDDDPNLYFVLYYISLNIEQAFDNQAMPVDLYKKYESLIPSFEDTLSKKDIDSLKQLIKAFVKIKGKNNFFV